MPTTTESTKKKPSTTTTPYASTLAQIKEIEEDPVVKALIAEKLPPNYDFEIGKTLWRIRKMGVSCRTVALQFPEGLLIFSTRIASILRTLHPTLDILLMGDITYGACCVDDLTASLLGADLLVHYGHSCLVPTVVANRVEETIYVFVGIRFDLGLAAGSIVGVILGAGKGSRDDNDEGEGEGRSSNKRRGNISIQYEKEEEQAGDDDGGGGHPKYRHISLVSTIQFAGSLAPLKAEVEERLQQQSITVKIEIPQSKPLSRGEVLGCTAPKVPGTDLIVYVGDGRFHLEAMMMANPGVVAYRYDPYNSTTTLEEFDHPALARSRSSAISKVLLPNSKNKSSHNSKRIGLILSTLGRQGNPKPLEHVYQKMLNTSGGGGGGGCPSFKLNPFIILMSEIMPAKLALFGNGDEDSDDDDRVNGWIQFACPRLSIDWGDSFGGVPVLTSYEGGVKLIEEVNRESLLVGVGDGAPRGCCGGGDYGNCGESSCSCSKSDSSSNYAHPMDYYSYDSCGGHTPNFGGGGGGRRRVVADNSKTATTTTK